MQYKYGLIGEKLGHSFSPMIHSHFGNTQYTLIPLSPNHVKDFICETSFLGVNVTIPYKQTVMQYCDKVSEEVKAIGCVNTIVKEKDGTITGYNTDAYGIEQLLKKANISVKSKKVLILGGGGTSLTARYVAEKLEAREVLYVSRKGPMYYDQLDAHADVQVIMDTTSVGMYPHNDGMAINLDMFPACEGVIDVVYNPLTSDLVLEAKKRKIPCAGGLYMLVAQARKAAELFLGKQIEEALIRKVYHTMKCHIENVVLVGMPGSGKSVIGRALAAKLNKTFVDTDKLIEQKAGKLITEIFRENGEAFFRELEQEAVAEAAKCSGQIIATGGGAILREDNVRHLKQNGRIYFVQRELHLLSTKERPLSVNEAALQQLYEERLPIYTRVADEIVANNTNIEDVVKKIEEDYS